MGYLKPVLSKIKNKDIFGFGQTLIHPKYRSKGIANLARQLMIKKNPKLQYLFASIEKQNMPSLRSVLKSGYVEEPKDRLNYLKQKGFLPQNFTRLKWKIK